MTNDTRKTTEAYVVGVGICDIDIDEIPEEIHQYISDEPMNEQLVRDIEEIVARMVARDREVTP